jgi:hypothetical protein
LAGHPFLDALLKKARRRVLTHLVVDKAALALTIGMGGAVLLLLFGTQILDWYWPVTLAVIGFGAGVYQLRGRIPSLYRVAQRIDRRVKLADALSTAFYFIAHPEPKNEAICRRQQQDAESAAAQVDLRAALPYTRSRYLLPAGALALAALALFAVRYGVTGSLDLNAPLVLLASDAFFPTPSEVAKNDARKGNIEPQTFDPGSPEQASNSEEELPESMMEPADSSSIQEASSKDFSKDPSKQDSGNQDDASKDGDDPDSGDSDKSGDQDGKESKSGDSSMLDKLRDALANMFNRNKSDSAKQSQTSQKGQKSEENEKGEGQKGDASSAEPGRDQNQNAKEQGDAKGGDSTNQPPSQEAAGSQGDKVGDKTIKEVEALQAMGKISELLGKRSANLQGEVMVEVGQTKQQLKTQWTSRDASHSDPGGEIHRDEVPLMYQEFVERYFEEIRKTPEGGARAKGKGVRSGR